AHALAGARAHLARVDRDARDLAQRLVTDGDDGSERGAKSFDLGRGRRGRTDDQRLLGQQPRFVLRPRRRGQRQQSPEAHTDEQDSRTKTHTSSTALDDGYSVAAGK